MKKKNMLLKTAGLSTLLLLSTSIANYSFGSTKPFDLKQPDIQAFMKQMVKKHNFKHDQLVSLFSNARLHQSILDAISRPAEAKPWHEYRPIFLTKSRMTAGVKFWQENADVLSKASRTYGVPEEIMLAIIGVETRYGKHKGRFPVLDSLATLAFGYPPRSQFFTGELEQYLLMTREENIDPLQQKGSYAGAMGMPQFISSSFRNYAVDFDGDGHRDLWNNNSDVVGSVANYFKKHKWQAGQPIAHRVKVHGNKYRKLLEAGLKPQFDKKTLMDNGIILPDGLPDDLKGALIELETSNGNEYWVGWHNFYVISRYNHSELYSMAVFQLSNEIKQAYTQNKP